MLLTMALSFRLYLARRLADDTAEDGRVYARLARNLLEQHVYSNAKAPPFKPSLIRLPGYSIVLAAIYSLFGHDNNAAVRLIQAALDTVTCGLVGLLAFQWQPDERRKRGTALSALALAAVCPFTAIYVGTILTETWANLFLITLCLFVTLAFKAPRLSKSLIWWGAAGLMAGTAVFFRPDSGLFAAAAGLALVIRTLVGKREAGSVKRLTDGLRQRFGVMLTQGATFSLAFIIVLVPWTVRNWRVFHLFQPLAPSHGQMPGEFVPEGYLTWVRTWIDDQRYIDPVIWSLNEAPVDIDELPQNAFDSAAERARVEELFDEYESPAEEGEETGAAASKQNVADAASAKPGAGVSPTSKAETAGAGQNITPPSAKSGTAVNGPIDTEVPATTAKTRPPEMTPALSAAFGEIARERIKRAPLRYYLWLPLKRACALWFDTHSDYYPFTGALLPLSDLDHGIHQHLWLPFFTGLVWIYTLFGIVGGWLLWRARDPYAGSWLLLAVLMIFIRLAFFSSMENPEPRYTVEFFPLLAVLGGMAIARLLKQHRTLE